MAEERKEDQQTREDEREFLRYLIQDTGDEIAPMMSEVTVAPGHDATMLKEMIVAAEVEEIDRGETTTQATVVETMIVAAARQNENAVAASGEMTMMTSTLETAGKDGKMKVTMTTDEAAVVRTTNEDSYDGRGGDYERDDCNERGGARTTNATKLWRHFRK